MTRTTLLLAWSLGLPAAGVLGYATSDAEGAGIAAIAFALAVGVVAGLAWAVGATARAIGVAATHPVQTQDRLVLAGGVAVAGWTVAVTSVLDGVVPLWGFLAGASLVGALVGTTCESPVGSLWHGTLSGGTGGVLTVYLAVYESFTMRPELTGVVVLSGVVAPLALGACAGVGGVVGGLSRRMAVTSTGDA